MAVGFCSEVASCGAVVRSANLQMRRSDTEDGSSSGSSAEDNVGTASENKNKWAKAAAEDKQQNELQGISGREVSSLADSDKICPNKMTTSLELKASREPRTSPPSECTRSDAFLRRVLQVQVRKKKIATKSKESNSLLLSATKRAHDAKMRLFDRAVRKQREAERAEGVGGTLRARRPAGTTCSCSTGGGTSGWWSQLRGWTRAQGRCGL